jgi:membrane-bound metal-dependent hydrolase YbcI (DUF457 family)
MDTITHGIAGAMIGKALFKGDEMFVRRAMNRSRLVTWATMLGAIFPDCDTFRDIFSHNEMLMITWHRSITHSLLLLPLFALLLAVLTRWFASTRKWEAPSLAALTGIYAVGILSHIFLDLVTTFGTMIWSPWKWSRPAWDLIFIIDFTLTGIFLVPQFLAWVQERPENSRRRAIICFAIFSITIFLIQGFAEVAGVPISAVSVLLFILLFGGLLSLTLGSPSRVKDPERPIPDSVDNASVSADKIRERWNRAGLASAVAYLCLALLAHHSALARVKNFAGAQKLQVQSLAALPFPPSLWRWDGLILTPRGVYELRLDLSQKPPNSSSTGEQSSEQSGATNVSPVEYRFYPEAQSNAFISAARELPEVKKVLWFDRFPVTRFHEEGGDSIVEILDMRFPQIRKGRPSPFTYRVAFDPTGRVLSQGWAK